MTKYEFLDGLRTALAGEVPASEIENNIKFYEDYINTKSMDIGEKDVLGQLGDPRLIAKTIIETYQISHGPMYNNTKNNGMYDDDYNSGSNSYEESQNHNYNDSNSKNNGRNFGFQIHTSLTWYQKLFLIIIAVLFITILVVVGGILIQLFFSIGFPLLIIYIGYRLLRNSTRR